MIKKITLCEFLETEPYPLVEGERYFVPLMRGIPPDVEIIDLEEMSKKQVRDEILIALCKN